MEPNAIVLSELSQTQKDKIYMLCFMCGTFKKDVLHDS